MLLKILALALLAQPLVWKSILLPLLGGLRTSYDYVVVGGGTAGIVIATRLAQRSSSVALIEAGGLYEVQSLAAIPAAAILPVSTDPTTRASIDWGFVAANQAGNRSIHYARGKCLGGSSALNYMIYQRPTREAMDRWASVVHDDSYSFDWVFPYFQKSVRFTAPAATTRFPNATARFDVNAYDPDGGPLKVSYSNYVPPFSTWMAKGMQAIGVDEVSEFNLGSLMGRQFCAMTIQPGNQRRSSSYTSFLDGMHPPSLTVLPHTLAKKVLFNQRQRAVGVQVQGPLGNTFTIRARKEVILSAGVFQSPQLLMVSGIGPADILEEHGIPVLLDRPGVGQNMWDHPFFALSHRVQVQTLTKVANHLPTLARELGRYILFGKGALTSTGTDYLAFEKILSPLRSSLSGTTREDLDWFPSDWPEVEYLPGSGHMGNMSNAVWGQPRDGYQYATMLAVLVAPLSRGNVTIRSADTSDLPVINPNWLASPTDQEVAVAAFKRLRQALHSDAMAPVLIGDEYFPGPHIQTDEQILAFIQENVTPLWHAAGTCKMGAPTDAMAVVDSEGRVLGTEGLRVVDASAFPFLPPGHPQATVYMLAEKIADAIVNGPLGSELDASEPDYPGAWNVVDMILRAVGMGSQHSSHVRDDPRVGMK